MFGFPDARDLGYVDNSPIKTNYISAEATFCMSSIFPIPLCDTFLAAKPLARAVQMYRILAMCKSVIGCLSEIWYASGLNLPGLEIFSALFKVQYRPYRIST